MVKKIVALNDQGRRIGESHPRSTIPDAVVVAMRDDFERHGMTMRETARKHGVAFWSARSILRYKRRAQVPRDFKTVEEPDELEDDKRAAQPRREDADG